MNNTNKRYRIGIVGIYHESNTFQRGLTSLEDFESHWLVSGENLLNEFRNTFHEIGGMLSELERHDVELLPIFFAAAVPGGIVHREAFDALMRKLLRGLSDHLPLDGCLVVPHGAAVAQGYADMDGHWLGAVREILGNDALIVGTFDPHANLSEAMVRATNALFAYRTNPHIDQKETGIDAAAFLVMCLQQRKIPRQYFSSAPLVISIEQQHTASYPCNMLYRRAIELEQGHGINRVNVVLGFPYADVPEMGTSFLVVCDHENHNGREAAVTMTKLLLSHQTDMVGKRNNPTAQLRAMETMAKPVLWLDMGDNVGGGALGDSVFLLKQVEKHSALKAVQCVFDPKAVAVANGFANGAWFELSLGRDHGLDNGDPYIGLVRLVGASDGRFEEPAPRHGGQTVFDMGEAVLLETGKGNLILVHSIRTPPFSLNQLTSIGVDIKNLDIIIAKGVNAPIAAFGPVCPSILQADSPGVTQADVTNFAYMNRKRPMFPFEAIPENYAAVTI